MKPVTRYIIVLTSVMMIVLAVVTYQGSYFNRAGALIVYTADAYYGEVDAITSGFANVTGIHTSIKSAGSFALAQQIAQGSPCDVFFSIAKSAVQKQYLANRYPGWAIAIGLDQMVIAYSKSSLSNSFASSTIALVNSSREPDTNTWRNFFLNLTSGNVKVGIADPSLDPAGLRGWLVLQAAGYLYANNTNIFIERILANRGNVTGEHAANLVTPLETGNIQFLLVYKSFAISHNLPYVSLDEKINFGNLKLAQFYSNFSYVLPTGIQRGSPIVLYVTVPLGANDEGAAYQLVSYTVKHSDLLGNFGMAVIKPAIVFNSTSLPASIWKLVDDGSLILGGIL